MPSETINYVYVLDRDGNPLMPTTRYGKVRRMLKEGRAVVAFRVPFTIRLTYEPETHVVQDVCAGLDPGRTNIGLAAVREDGQCLYLAHVGTNNKQVPKHMADRAEHRRASRSGERKRRQRRARQNGTEFMDFRATPMGVRPAGKMRKGRFVPTRQRRLPGFGEGKAITVRGITNSEARFNNRRRPDGWFTPTATHLLRTHLNAIELICRILPVTGICVELNRFAFMALNDPDIWKHRQDFQNGPLKGCGSVGEAVDAMQGGKCLLCGGPIERHHHMLPRSEYGSDTFGNIVGLCSACHDKVHKDDKTATRLDTLHGRQNKKYGALSVLNQIIPRLMDELGKRFPGHAYATTGHNTMLVRDSLGLPKEHCIDACCIALQGLPDWGEAAHASAFPKVHEIAQFRRHNRALIHCQHERAYKLEGETVAKNCRKRTGQKDPALDDWYAEQADTYGEKEAQAMLSRLTVRKSERLYNPTEREFSPGDAVLFEGRRYIVTGQQSRGRYLQFYGFGDKRFKACNCRLLQKNRGLVYID